MQHPQKQLQINAFCFQVSGIDPGTAEEEVYASAQEGLATAFELGSKDAVTVGPAGSLDGQVESPSRRRRRRLAPPETAGAVPTPPRRLGAAFLDATYLAEVDFLSAGGAVGGGYPVRRLQEGTSNGTTVDMDFELALPTDSEDEKSPAARAAAVVNDYADGGVVLALADSLGVEPSDVRYCCVCCGIRSLHPPPFSHMACFERLGISHRDSSMTPSFSCRYDEEKRPLACTIVCGSHRRKNTTSPIHRSHANPTHKKD